MKYIPYMIAGGIILWFGIGRIEVIQTTIEACKPTYETPHPACKVGEDIYLALEFLRYLVMASAVAIPSLVYLIHSGKAGV